MTHHHITRVMYIALVATAISLGSIIFIISDANQAQAFSLFQPYAGWIVTPPLPNLTPLGIPNPACPVYSIVQNADLTGGLPPEFGIFIPPFLPSPTYDYGNLAVPGTPVIGGLVPIPCVGGVQVIPIYPLYYDAVDGPFYLTGTGAF